MPLQTVAPQRLYRQIADQLRKGIASGEFAPGTRLPSVRQCAQQQGVSPSTVVAAYDQLLAQGLVEARRQRGFGGNGWHRFVQFGQGAQRGFRRLFHRRIVALVQHGGPGLGGLHKAPSVLIFMQVRHRTRFDAIAIFFARLAQQVHNRGEFVFRFIGSSGLARSVDLYVNPLQLFDLILQHFVFDLGVGDVLLGLDALVPFFLSDAGGTWKELSVLVMLLRMRKFLM